MSVLRKYRNKLIPRQKQFRLELSSYYKINLLYKGLKESYNNTISCVDKLNQIYQDPINLSHANAYIVYTTVYLSEFEKFYNELKYRICKNKELNWLMKNINKFINMLRVILPNCNLLFTYY